MKVLAIAGVSLRRLFRERSNIFYVIVSPLLFLLVLGLVFGGGQPLRLGVAGELSDPMAQRLVDRLDSDGRVVVDRFDTGEALRVEVQRGTVNAGVLIPDGYGRQVREGGQAEVTFLSRTGDPGGVELGVWVRSVVRQESALLQAAHAGGQAAGMSFEDGLRAADAVTSPGVRVELTTAGEALFPTGLNRFAPSAPSLLLLFTFLTSLTASLNLIQSRRLGVTGRIMATPTPMATIVAGEALGRFAVALTQGLVVMGGAALLFGVDWGDPAGAAALLVVYCLVGSGAAMLLGSLFREEGPAIGVALGLGLGLGALGGTMLPLELMSDSLRTIARFTPHAWGYEGFAELVRFGGGIGDILPQLGVLSAYAAVLFALGIWRLHRAVTTAA